MTRTCWQHGRQSRGRRLVISRYSTDANPLFVSLANSLAFRPRLFFPLTRIADESGRWATISFSGTLTGY